MTISPTRFYPPHWDTVCGWQYIPRNMSFLVSFNDSMIITNICSRYNPLMWFWFLYSSLILMQCAKNCFKLFWIPIYDKLKNVHLHGIEKRKWFYFLTETKPSLLLFLCLKHQRLLVNIRVQCEFPIWLREFCTFTFLQTSGLSKPSGTASVWSCFVQFYFRSQRMNWEWDNQERILQVN